MVLTKLQIRFLILLAVVPTVILTAAVRAPVAGVQAPAAQPKFNPLKALSIGSMVAGGSSLTAGGVALGLRLWRNKLKKDLIEARGLVELSPQNSLEKFLAQHQVASIEQDIVSLKKYSQWLLAAAGVLGVGAIGSVSFDMGKALAERKVPVIPGRQGPPPPPQIIEQRVEVLRPQHNITAQKLAAQAAEIQEVDAAHFAIADRMSSVEKAVCNYELAHIIANHRQRHDDRQRELLARAALEEELGVPLDRAERDGYFARGGTLQEYAQRIIRMNQVLNRLYPAEPVNGQAARRTWPETEQGVISAFAQEEVEGAGAYANNTVVSPAERMAIQRIEKVLKKWKDDSTLLAQETRAIQELEAARSVAPQNIQNKYKKQIDERVNLRENLQARKQAHQEQIEKVRSVLNVAQPGNLEDLDDAAVAEYYKAQRALLNKLEYLGIKQDEIKKKHQELQTWVQNYFTVKIAALITLGKAETEGDTPQALKYPNNFAQTYTPLWQALQKVSDDTLYKKLNKDLQDAGIEPFFFRLQNFDDVIKNQFARTDMKDASDKFPFIKLPQVGAQTTGPGGGKQLQPLSQILDDNWFNRVNLFKEHKELLNRVEEQGHDAKSKKLNEVAQALGFADSAQVDQYDLNTVAELSYMAGIYSHRDEGGLKELGDRAVRLPGLRKKIEVYPESFLKQHLVYWLDLLERFTAPAGPAADA